MVKKREKRHRHSDCNGDGPDGEERGQPGPTAFLPQNGPVRKRSPISVFESEDLPLIRHAFQGMAPTLLESCARSERQVPNCAGEDDVAGPGEARDASADVHREAAHLLPHTLAFAGVESRANRDAHLPHRLDDLSRAFQSLRRRVERCEQTVAGGVDLLAVEPFQLASGDAVIGIQDSAPRSIAHRSGEIRGSHDVREQDRRDEPLGDRSSPHFRRV